jgi:catechol 2,3-dioxygenase-like lactoylglutathione lyase family enzyme
VTFKVSDLSKSRRYYQGVLGMTEAFQIKDTSGKTSSAMRRLNPTLLSVSVLHCELRDLAAQVPRNLP